MKRVFSTLFLALVIAVFAVGCGSDDGGSDAVPTDSVAVVGDQSIPKSEFEDLITYAKRSYDAQKRPFPKVGTPEYVQLRDQAMNFLIQRTQFEVKANELDIDVSDEAVDKRIDQYIKERHQGDKKKFDAELKSQGLSPEQARDIIRANLVQEAIFNKVTKEVKVTDEQAKAYYDKNKAQYGTPETRAVRHVLVKPNQKALADQLYTQLKAGGNWSEIAKKYSQDPASKNQGGKMTATKGQLVPEFEQTAFTIGDNGISKPVKTQYGWHIIQALGPVKESQSTPYAQVQEAIRQQLLQENRNKEMEKWVADMRKDLEGETTYQTGYKPKANAPAETG
ncbi:MAG TPA: peptidylprolyl isomerase [Gaiellaceae bacterium]|jgi:parvulin-like peptidyl-prolyl isomerase|nr:peptidylprolyl isomerase [Gaiellaceae bacterium]